MYSPQLIDHFQHPRNVGDLARPDATARVENPACGDLMTLQLQLVDGVITAARFQVKGCVAAIACGSALTDAIQGRSLDEARSLRREHIVAAVGGLPAASDHAAHLAFDALQAALHRLSK